MSILFLRIIAAAIDLSTASYGISVAWNAWYRKKAKMPIKKSPHDIRRTVITHMYYDEGIKLRDIMHWAGHTTEQQTLEYIKTGSDGIATRNKQILTRNTENIIEFPIHKFG